MSQKQKTWKQMDDVEQIAKEARDNGVDIHKVNFGGFGAYL